MSSALQEYDTRFEEEKRSTPAGGQTLYIASKIQLVMKQYRTKKSKNTAEVNKPERQVPVLQ